jgi:serine/threonine protein kinase
MSLTNSMDKDTRANGRSAEGPHPALLSEGMMLQNRYRIVRPLGKGGMGAVYEAVDERLDATVALKETFSVDDRLRRQFEQEARLLAQLNHPALPRVSDYFTEGERAFLVMQFISGVDLAEIIAKQPGPFPRNQVVAWADQLLDALIFLHTRERQIIHRDIKPHNLKLTPNGMIALLDFGLAKAATADRSSRDNSICGYTRRYAPLEQIQDQGTTPQSDIYALGATLYHLLTGIKPADAVIREAALVGSMPDPLRPANEVHPSVGSELAEILSRAMAQSPADRYPDAAAFREALAQLGRSRMNDEPTPASPAEPIKLPDRTDQDLARAERVRAISRFDNYTILKPEEPTWFIPRPGTRSNLAVTGILFVLLSALLGTLYAVRRWTETSTASQVKTNTNQHVSTPNGSQNKLRLNTANGLSGISTPASASDRERASVGPSVAKGRTQFRLESTSLNAQTIVPLQQSEQRAEVRPRVNVPNTRLPRAELKDNDPAPSFPRLPAYGQPESPVEKQVLRTPDGIQVVKFSDGTTKVFRPGEKSAQVATVPQK